jgi:hypothetical protein
VEADARQPLASREPETELGGGDGGNRQGGGVLLSTRPRSPGWIPFKT